MVFKSIQSSLIAVVVFAIAIATTVVVSIAIDKHEAAFSNAAQKASTGLNRVMSKQLSEAQTPLQKQAILDQFSLFPNIVYAAQLDSDTKVTYQFDSLFPGQDIIRANVALAEIKQNPSLGSFWVNDLLVTVSSGASKSMPDAWLVVVSDITAPLKLSRKNLLLGLMPFIAGITLVVLLVAILLLSRLSRPLLELCDFTRRVEEESDYSLRIPVKGSQEFKVLQNNVNKLMDTISNELGKNEQNTKDLLLQQKAMSKLANFDSLTELPNRQFVMDNLKLDLARAKRTKQNIALLFFDLDGFKNINDTLGHETGDKLLVAVAERVHDVLREGDLVARLGGDEFLIVPDRTTGGKEQDSVDLAKRLLSAFEQAFAIDEVDLQIGLSIGIANAEQAEYDLNVLISNADIAMYRSKSSGRGMFTVFKASMAGDNKRKLEISNSILASLEADEFKIAYQPKIGAYGKITGFEALMRWKHPTLGVVSPAEFIPVAEQGGKIHVLTAWILKTVCSEVKTLLALSSETLKVSINLSAHDLHNQDLYQNLTDMLTKYDVKAKNIELEVTESALLDNFTVSNRFFKKASLLGCSIALDDFGTGYSSLSYLTQMKVDKLKIDRQFVLELDTSERSRLVTRTIIDLAKRLDLETCAEGVENHFQQDYLLTYGCNEFQGFFYGKPVYLEDMKDSNFDYSELFNSRSD